MKNTILFTCIFLLSSCVSREKLITKSWKFADVELQGGNDSTTLAFQNNAGKQIKSNLNIELGADSSESRW